MTKAYHRNSEGEIKVCRANTRPCRFEKVEESEILDFVKIEKRNLNNETVGISTELAICETFGTDFPQSMIDRSNSEIVENVRSFLEKNKQLFPEIVSYTGERSNPVDFVSKNGETISVKTNTNGSRKVCPQIIGQSTLQKHVDYFSNFYKDYDLANMSKNDKRDMVKAEILKNPELYLREYWNNLFHCDKLIYFKDIRPGAKLDKNSVVFMEKVASPVFDRSKISFTKSTVESWNESTTVKYGSMTLGEFQIHNNRDGIKFRFDMRSVEILLKAMNH